MARLVFFAWLSFVFAGNIPVDLPVSGFTCRARSKKNLIVAVYHSLTGCKDSSSFGMSSQSQIAVWRIDVVEIDPRNIEEFFLGKCLCMNCCKISCICSFPFIDHQA